MDESVFIYKCKQCGTCRFSQPVPGEDAEIVLSHIVSNLPQSSWTTRGNLIIPSQAVHNCGERCVGIAELAGVQDYDERMISVSDLHFTKRWSPQEEIQTDVDNDPITE